MAGEPRPHDFAYIQTDIPPGMTIREWRADRASSTPPRRSWHRVARALARHRIARVRVRGGRHRAPRPAAPPNTGGTP